MSCGDQEMEQMEVNVAHLQYQVHILETESRRLRQHIRELERHILLLETRITDLEIPTLLDSDGDVRPCDR